VASAPKRFERSRTGSVGAANEPVVVELESPLKLNDEGRLNRETSALHPPETAATVRDSPRNGLKNPEIRKRLTLSFSMVRTSTPTLN
jgi:hypothetical protein